MAATTTNHWKLGLFVVIGLVALVASLFWVGAQRFSREAFDAVVFFDESVQGLDIGSPVKFRGVMVGTVRNITIAPDHRHVQVTSDIYVDAVRSLGISDGKPDPKSGQPFMPENLRVQLVASGITGVRFLEVDFFDPRRYPAPVLPFPPPWDYIPSAPSTLRSLEEAALEFANRLPALGDQTTATLTEGREALIEGRATLAAVRQLAAELQGHDGAVERLVARLDRTATTLETAVREAQLAATTQSLREASGSVTGAANGVSVGIGDVSEDLQPSLIALRETLEALRSFIDGLDRDPSMLVRGRRPDGVVPSAAK